MLIVRVDVADPLTVGLLRDALTPVGLAGANVAVELNPFRGLMLIMEVAEAPVPIDKLDGAAERLKSSKLKVAVVV